MLTFSVLELTAKHVQLSGNGLISKNNGNDD